MPANTYIASALSASAVGAIPVLVVDTGDYPIHDGAIEARSRRARRR